MRLIQIVPELPPAVGGIGAYASLLAQGLDRLGIATRFVLCERAGTPPAPAGAAAGDVALVPARPGALAQRLESLRPDAVLVHYGGYGYARRGAPLWLARGLRLWRARAPRTRLIVMFHEVWAVGPPWRSSFWLHPAQRAVAARLVRLADAFLTNADRHARRLRRLVPDRAPAAVLPVLSNVGELADPPPLARRELLAVVFGRPGARRRVYDRIEEFLPLLRAAGVEGVLDIGPPLADGAVARAPLPVTRCGYLDARLASAALLRARFGLLDCPVPLAAKSGVLAAYTAHGVVPVIRSQAGGPADRLRHGVNFVHAAAGPLPWLPAAAQSLSTASNLWYRTHGIGPTSRRFAAVIADDEQGHDRDHRAA